MEGNGRRKYTAKRKKAGTEERKKEQRDEQLVGLLGIDNYMILSYRVEHYRTEHFPNVTIKSQTKGKPNMTRDTRGRGGVTI